MENQQTLSVSVLQALSEIDPWKAYSPELFNALARLTRSQAIESVCVRRSSPGGVLKIYLTRRAQTDAAYPGILHSPGSIQRPYETVDMVLARLSAKEFGAPIVAHEFVCRYSTTEARGCFDCNVYLVRIDGEPHGGTWYPVDALPTDVIDHHREQLIPRVLQFIEQHR
jgi:hypothetical protein